MKKTMLTVKTLNRFEREYITDTYTADEIEKIEFAAYVANMNKCNHPEWTESGIFADFLRCLAIDKIATQKREMVEVTTYTTGSRRGYIRVAARGVETDPQPIPADLHGLRGNIRRALDYLQRRGCTHYTVCDWQGVPSKGYSNQYCYTVYTGYTA